MGLRGAPVVTWLLLAASLVHALPAGPALAQPARVESPPVSAPAPAPAMTDEARGYYERGLRLYADKDYPAAIAEFHAGYAIEPRREFLFAEAQAKRLAGDCAGAVGLYQKFLETEPTAAQVNATQMGLARCAQQMAAAPTAPAVTPQPQSPTAATTATVETKPPAAPTLPPAPPPPASPRVSPWYRDAPGTALLGAGVLGLGVGGGFLAASFAARGSASSYDEYARQRQTAESRWNVAMVALVAGGLLTGAAITRYALVRRRTSGGFEVAAALAPATAEAALGVLGVLGGRF